MPACLGVCWPGMRARRQLGGRPWAAFAWPGAGGAPWCSLGRQPWRCWPAGSTASPPLRRQPGQAPCWCSWAGRARPLPSQPPPWPPSTPTTWPWRPAQRQPASGSRPSCRPLEWSALGHPSLQQPGLAARRTPARTLQRRRQSPPPLLLLPPAPAPSSCFTTLPSPGPPLPQQLPQQGQQQQPQQPPFPLLSFSRPPLPPAACRQRQQRSWLRRATL